MNSHNHFVKILKKINNFIDSLLKRNLNKLNAANLKKLIVNNKFFLIVFGAIILFFSYLSIPNIFNQNEISAKIKKDLLNELKLEFNFKKKLDYKFLPRPHFTIKESLIIFNDNKISEIKKIKIYVSLNNLFSLKNIKIKNIIIEKGNFNLNKNNYSFFIDLLDSNFKNLKVEIINSNIFYRNLQNEVLFVNNIANAKYIYDPKESKNILYSKNKIFNLPYSIELFTDKKKKHLIQK